MGAMGNVKVLVIVIAIIGLVSIGLLVSTIVLGVKLKNKSKEVDELKNAPSAICTSPECVKASADMIRAMDFNVNPCENFYQFACGTWVKENPIPSSSSSWNQFNILRERLSMHVKEILEHEIDNESDPSSLKLAKTFYNSCMGQNTTDQTELYNLIQDLLSVGVNPLDSKLGELRRRIGGAFLINIYVELDEEIATQYITYVDQPSLGLNRAFLVDESHPNRKAYRDLIEQVWPLVYPLDNNFARISDEIIAFETQLANISTAPEDRRNRSELYNLMSLREFSEHTATATMIDWATYVTEVFKDVVEKHDVNLGNLPDLKVVVRDLRYYSQFGDLIARTNYDTIANYLKFRLILGLGNDVSDQMRQVFFEFTKKTQGTQTSPEKWKLCSDKANANLGMAISYQYVQDVFSGDFETKMNEMITDLKTSLYTVIDTVDWISSEETRAKAKVKADKMKNFIGYPTWLVNNNTALDTYYKGLLLNTPENHLENTLEITNWKNMEGLKRIQESKDTDKWITDPTVVNAFYSSTYNSISFPAGILQPPFYFTGNPIQALNFGAVGAVIGHEITHGYDDRGRQSDGDGNLINWWDESTIQAYIEKAECFVNQYSKYAAEEANNATLNGQNTLGENIADNGGLSQAWYAYKSYVSKHGTEEKLPGLEMFDPEQLFFIAFAQIWCGSYTPQGMENQIRTGVHSPNRFRVQGVLENSLEFATTWNCKIPENSCKIW